MCCCSKCKVPCLISAILLIVGGLNWGLVGLGGFLKTNLNLVNLLFGQWPTVEGIVYLLVGLSAIALVLHRLLCKCCKECCKDDNSTCCKK